MNDIVLNVVIGFGALILGGVGTYWIGPRVAEKFKLRQIYLAPYRKWCSETYGELEEFYKRYLEGKHSVKPGDYLILILDYRELHEVLRDAPRYIGKIKKDKKQLIDKFWNLLHNVDESWHRLGQDFRHCLPAVEDVKYFEEYIKNSLSDDQQKHIAKRIRDDMNRLNLADMKKILDFLESKIP